MKTSWNQLIFYPERSWNEFSTSNVNIFFLSSWMRWCARKIQTRKKILVCNFVSQLEFLLFFLFFYDNACDHWQSPLYHLVLIPSAFLNNWLNLLFSIPLQFFCPTPTHANLKALRKKVSASVCLGNTYSTFSAFSLKLKYKTSWYANKGSS